MNDPLTLPQQPVPYTDPISLGFEAPQPPPLPDETVRSRAAKATLGLADITGHNFGDWYNLISSGKEADLRKEAAARTNQVNIQKKQQDIIRSAMLKDPDLANKALAPIPQADPSSVIEDAYANSYMHPLLNNRMLWPEQISNLSPREQQIYHNIGTVNVGQREYLNKTVEDLESELSQQSWPGFLADQLKSMIPGYDDLKLRGNTDQVSYFKSFLGGNLARQAEQINAGWPGTKKQFDDTIAKLRKDNLGDAYMFAKYALGQSSSQQRFDDVFDIVNFSNLFGISKSAAGKLLSGGSDAAKVWGVTRQLAKAAEEVGEPPKTLEGMVEGPIKQSAQTAGTAAVGDQQGAGVQKQAEDLIKFTKGETNPELNAYETLADVNRIDRQERDYNLGAYGRELRARINEAEDTFMQGLIQTFKDSLRVNRIADITWAKEQYEKVAQALKDKYFGPDNQIMNILGPYRGIFSNTWTVDFVMGKNGTEYFDTLKDAMNSPILKRFPLEKKITDVTQITGFQGVVKPKYYKRTLPGSQIVKDGYGYAIKINLPLDEIDDVVRDSLGKTPDSFTPKDIMGGWIDATIGVLRNPDETQSFDQTFARKIATYAPSNFLEFVRDNLKDMRAISPASSRSGLFNRERWDRFERTLRYGQNAFDPVTKKQGMFFHNAGDLEAWYLSTFKDGLPDEAFEAAYFEFKRIIEADRFFRITTLVRNKQRMGVLSHTLSVTDDTGAVVKSNPVEAMITKDKLGGEGTVLVLGDKLIESKLLTPDSLQDLGLRSEADEAITKGSKVHLRVWDPQSYPVKELLTRAGLPADARIQHIVAPNVETRPVDWHKQLGRTGGGHLEQDHKFYLKWAKMAWDPVAKKWWYHGDGTFGVGDNEAELEKYGQQINAIHDFMAKGDKAGAMAYHAQSDLPMAWKDLLADYNPTKNPETGELSPPRLNPKEKLRVVPRDKMLIDMDKDLENRYGDAFRDGTRQGSPARQAQVQFTGERDVYELQHISDRGSRYSPLYDLRQPDLVDPITMMNRAMGTIINSLYMDDIKNTAVEHWLFGNSTGDGKGAAQWLETKYPGEGEIRHSPFYFFLDGKFKAGTPVDVRLRLEADRMKIRMFLGQPNKIEAALDAASEKLANTLYQKYGPKALNAYKWVPQYLIPAINNGPQFMRNVIYRAKMGFFSPRQFFIHFFTIMNAALIAGWDAASHGGLAAIFHGYSSMNANPKVLAHMDSLMEKFGWKPGQWLEARDGALKTGFFHVERGRLALVDNPISDNVLDNWRQSFLEKGQMTFRGGVRSLKAASWYMAYHEWRKINPIAKMDDEALSRILERSDILSHNMSRASTSYIQKGIATFGAQFTSYNLRVLELLTGKRLTVPEKIRLFFGYGTVLGVPTAAGIVPLTSYLYNIRQHAQDAGYVPGQDLVATAFMEGMLPLALYGATGHVYNVGESYGAKDLDIVDKALSGDASIYEVMGGAAYSALKNVSNSADGFWNAMGSMYRGDGLFKPKLDDFLSVFKEISTVNYALRAYVGASTGRYISRNESYLSDTTAANAIASGIFGVQEQETADIYDKSLTEHQWKAQEAKAFKQYSLEMTRWMTALSQGNYADAADYQKRAQVYLEMLPTEERARAMSDVIRNNMSLKQRVDWNFYVGPHVPDAERADKLKTFQQIQQREQQYGR